MTAERLYGREHDEVLYDDPASVYEAWADEAETVGRESFQIVEWDVIPNRKLLPSADQLLTDLLERHVSDELPDGYGYEQWEKAAERADVLALIEHALSHLASKVAYAVADKELRRLTVTWTDDDEPLLDGAPMYRAVTP